MTGPSVAPQPEDTAALIASEAALESVSVAPDLVQCQGCGAIRGGHALGKGHACWRNEDGTYEEGGTFQ